MTLEWLRRHDAKLDEKIADLQYIIQPEFLAVVFDADLEPALSMPEHDPI